MVASENKGASFIKLPPRPAEDKPAEEPQIFVVMHENWQAWKVFDLCSDQWNVVYLYSVGGGCIPFYQSFNLQSVESVMRSFGIKPGRRRHVLRGVKFIADGAKSILNDR